MSIISFVKDEEIQIILARYKTFIMSSIKTITKANQPIEPKSLPTSH